MRAPKRSRSRTIRGLATLAIAMLIGMTGCVARSRVVPRDDALITEDVRARLAADGQTKPFAIKVGARGGGRWRGAEQHPPARAWEARVAREPRGVLSVDTHVIWAGEPVPGKTSN